MKVLSTALLQGFPERVAEWLGRQHPQLVNGLAPAALRAQIASGLARCKAYGLATEHQLASYIRLRLWMGEAFDSNPQIMAVLETGDLDPDAKIDIAEDICKSLMAERG